MAQNVSVLKDMWNDKCMKLVSSKSFQARLIPLNKKWPDIPQEDEFRPIVVYSSLIKWLELRFLPPLQEFLKYKLDKYQIGFVPQC